MKHISQWVVGAVVSIAGLALSGCAAPSAALSVPNEAAVVEPVAGSDDLSRVTLTQQAADRLGVETGTVSTAPVARNGGPTQARLVVPYGAVMYDGSGATWVYATDDSLSFVRQGITVDFIDGDVVVLLAGPAEGTSVATVATAELFGAEFGIDH